MHAKKLILFVRRPRTVAWCAVSFLLLLAVAGCALRAASAADGRWVTTWGCGPQLTEPHNSPPVPLAHSTLRQFVRTTLGGKLIRVRFSNAYGTDPVTINAAHVALSAGAGSAGVTHELLGVLEPVRQRLDHQLAQHEIGRAHV